jgi:outer membrane protein assembly factor BamB
LKTGKILWQRWIDSDVMSAPIASGKELYATSFSGILYKFDQATGEILSATRSRATSAPVIVNGEVFLTQRSDDGRGPAVEQNRKLQSQNLAAINNFHANARRAEYIDPSVQEKTKLAAAGNQLDAGNGFAGGAPAAANPTAAKSNIGQMNVSTMQAFQGSRFTAVGNWAYNVRGDEILCTKGQDGSQIWSMKLEGDLKAEGGFLAAPPVAAGGQLFVATLKGEVLQLDPKTGKVNVRHKVGGPVRSQPVVEAGRIFVGTDDGKLVCINTGNPKFTGWPMWGKDAAHSSVQESP